MRAALGNRFFGALAFTVCTACWGVTSYRLWQNGTEEAIHPPRISGRSLLDLLAAPVSTLDGKPVRIVDQGKADIFFFYFTRSTDCFDVMHEVSAVVRAFGAGGGVSVIVAPDGYHNGELRQFSEMFEFKPMVTNVPHDRIKELRLPRTPYRVVLSRSARRILAEGLAGRTPEEELGFLAEVRHELAGLQPGAFRPGDSRQ